MSINEVEKFAKQFHRNGIKGYNEISRKLFMEVQFFTSEDIYRVQEAMLELEKKKDQEDQGRSEKVQ